MARRKMLSVKWTLVLLVVLVCPLVYSRPQESSSPSPVSEASNDKATENPTRKEETSAIPSPIQATDPNSARDVKRKTPAIGESIKMVASQLLETNVSSENTAVIDTRIPPKVKNQVAQKNKQKVRNEDATDKIENAHTGVAVPITMEELEQENKLPGSNDISTSTSNEGISTWVLLTNTVSKDNATPATEPIRVEEPPKKQKLNATKNKTKRPAQNANKNSSKRPIIASNNKADLVAGGSAINDNVLNKLKDTVLSNVQKNKSTTQKATTTTTTTTTTTAAPTTELTTTKRYKEEVTKAATPALPVIKVTSKPTKKKNKNKQKVSTTTEEPIFNESALLPMEAKEQEIELEISTPSTTTKKPKRSSTKRKKNKTKKRKTTTSTKIDKKTEIIEVKNSNKTKSSKPSKTPDNPLTTQIYNYLSREVMPSVGVGVIGLAGLVGLASYFFYPFATPVRRTFEVDKKDDIYRHNAEEYGNEGNGQAEEEMLGTVLAGMPAHSKHKLNPYIGQMATQTNRYPTKKEQDLKYRQVTKEYETPNYNVRYPQQKTGLAHGVVYPEPVNPYQQQQPQQHETRNVYTTEMNQYAYNKGAYTPYPAVEPIYAAPQTGPSSISGYGNDASNSVVYGVKPSPDVDFKPVYPFEGQVFSETTSSASPYQSTSMYLGSNNEMEQTEEDTYQSEESQQNETSDNKFVVGNVPKELVDSETPAIVPEHGPRKLNRRRRNVLRARRGIIETLEEALRQARQEKKGDFISNEIDEPLAVPMENLVSQNDVASDFNIKDDKVGITTESINANSVDTSTTTDIPTTTFPTKIIESVSSVPLDKTEPQKTTTESAVSNELDYTTKPFRVFEVFSSPPTTGVDMNSLLKDITKEMSTTDYKMNTETTTDLKSETASTLPSLSMTEESKKPIKQSKPTNNPDVITYPPLTGDGGFFSFLKRLVEFKYRLGLSILQTTSENLNRYLRSMETSVNKMAKGSL